MSQYLPHVVASRSPADHKRELDLIVPAALDHFAGHFPGLPILPGVVQLDWAVRWGREFFNITGDFSSLGQLKFQATVFPETKLLLALVWDPEKSQLGFAYSRINEQGAKQKVSSGRFSFSGLEA